MTSRSGNRNNSVNRNFNTRGGAGGGFKDAQDLEEAAYGVNLINWRNRLKTRDINAAKKAAKIKAKITLPSLASLERLLRDDA